MRLCHKEHIKDKNNKIAIKLKMRREHLGITVKQLSKKIGVSHQQLAKYEKGTNQLSLALADDIAKIFGISVANLVPSKNSLTDTEYGTIEDVYNYAQNSPKLMSGSTIKLLKAVMETQDDNVIMFLLDSLKGLKPLMKNNQSKEEDTELIY